MTNSALIISVKIILLLFRTKYISSYWSSSGWPIGISNSTLFKLKFLPSSALSWSVHWLPPSLRSIISRNHLNDRAKILQKLKIKNCVYGMMTQLANPLRIRETLSIPYGGWFVSQLFHFWSALCLWPEKKEEDDPSLWAPTLCKILGRLYRFRSAQLCCFGH